MGLGWLLVNIVMPVAIPPIGILFLWLGTPPGNAATGGANFRFMALFKDGQLAWIAAGMCAAALYEFVETIVAYNEYKRHIPLIWFTVLIPLLFSIVGAMLVAASGAAYGTTFLAAPAQFKNWISHYRTFVSSVIVTAASAITCSVIHFRMLPESSSYLFPVVP
jgi:hypothetical protein